MFNPQSFENRVLIITGASRGIGAYLAQQFATHGAVVHNLDHQPPLSTTESTVRLPTPTHHHRCDVQDAQAVQTCINSIFQQHKRIDALIINAGQYHLHTLLQTTPDALHQVFATNVYGAYFSIQAVLPAMQHANFGRIVIMSSDQAVIGRKGGTAYGMSKAALVQLSKSLSAELAADYNIRINCLCPSSVNETPMTQHAAEHFSQKMNQPIAQVYEQFAQDIPTKQLISLQSIAAWVMFLAHPQQNDLTGAAIVLDGGLSTIR